MLASLLHYLAHLRPPKIILWCYLIWYLTMATCHFDATPALWINSLGISLVIGTALVLGVLPPGGIAAMEKWQVARLFLMPLAVSSFAALIKGKGFIVIISPIMRENVMALLGCGVFVVVVALCKRRAKPKI